MTTSDETASDAAPALSVVVATTRPWPEIRRTLDALLPQAERAGAEVIVADGDGHGLDADPGAPVVWLREPGHDRFVLHASALRRARGAIVAVTEDHCIVPPDWCARTLAAHAAHPTMPCIVGVARNGATRTVLERASFLMNSGMYMPPRAHPAERPPPVQNLSIKRAVMEHEEIGPGWLEYGLLPRAHRDGQLAVVGDLVVSHDQHLTRRRAIAIHFHNGRVHGALFHRAPARQRLSGLRFALRVPRMVTGQLRGAVRAGESERVPALDMAGVWAVAAVHSIAFVVGLLAGAGESARRLT